MFYCINMYSKIRQIWKGLRIIRRYNSTSQAKTIGPLIQTQDTVYLVRV